MHASIVRLLLVFGALAVIVAALFAIPLWISRSWMRRHPNSKSARKVITRTGFVLYGCQTLLLFVGLSARELQPHGPLGEFLQPPGGLLAYLVLLIVGFSTAAALLAKWGHPCMRERRDV
jgi:hypothetical protein